MPTYTFKNHKTGEEWTEIISIAKRDEILQNPDITQLVIARGNGTDGFVAGVGGPKASEGLRDILREIKRVNPGNTIDIL